MPCHPVLRRCARICATPPRDEALTLPVAAIEFPAIIALNPCVRGVVVTAALAHPVAPHPDVPAAVPVPVARRPNVPCTGRRDDFDARRGRCNLYVHRSFTDD